MTAPTGNDWPDQFDDTPPPPWDDQRDFDADDQVEDGLQFNREVSEAAWKIKVRDAARDRVSHERTGDVLIPAPTRLDEFLARPLDPVTHRIDGLWPSGGNVLVAAQFKAGKTTLRDNAMRALVDDELFLGAHQVHPFTGSVTLLDFELDEHTLQRWLSDQGYQHPERINVVSMKGHASSFDILDSQLRTRWAKILASVETSILVVDCLRPILDALGLDENHDAGRFLVAMDELIREAGATESLTIHHMGHGSERSRGDSRLRDWPDAEWKLVRDKDDEDPTADNVHGSRYFSAFGRDVDHPQTELTFTPETRHLSLGAVGIGRKDAAKRRQITEAADAVLTLLAETPGLGKRALRMAVRDVTSGVRNESIDQAVQELKNAGSIHVAINGQNHFHYLVTATVPHRAPSVPGTPGATVPRAYRGTGAVSTTDTLPINETGHGHGPNCNTCKTPLDPHLAANGETTHPTCDTGDTMTTTNPGTTK